MDRQNGRMSQNTVCVVYGLLDYRSSKPQNTKCHTKCLAHYAFNVPNQKNTNQYKAVTKGFVKQGINDDNKYLILSIACRAIHDIYSQSQNHPKTSHIKNYHSLMCLHTCNKWSTLLKASLVYNRFLLLASLVYNKVRPMGPCGESRWLFVQDKYFSTLTLKVCAIMKCKTRRNLW